MLLPKTLNLNKCDPVCQLSAEAIEKTSKNCTNFLSSITLLFCNAYHIFIYHYQDIRARRFSQGCWVIASHQKAPEGNVLAPGNALWEECGGRHPQGYQDLIPKNGLLLQRREDGLQNNFAWSGDAVATRKRALGSETKIVKMSIRVFSYHLPRSPRGWAKGMTEKWHIAPIHLFQCPPNLLAFSTRFFVDDGMSL